MCIIQHNWQLDWMWARGTHLLFCRMWHGASFAPSWPVSGYIPQPSLGHAQTLIVAESGRVEGTDGERKLYRDGSSRGQEIGSWPPDPGKQGGSGTSVHVWATAPSPRHMCICVIVLSCLSCRTQIPRWNYEASQDGNHRA